MSRIDLLKKLLPGFLPLFVFIAADEIWGTETGLIVAVVFGIGQLGFTFIREKRLDKFVLFDTLLIVVLGAVSILLDNDIFFKLKPGLINLILVLILGISAYSGLNIMGKMSERYMKGIEINQAQQMQMNRSMRILFWIFLLHTALVFYSAFYMSKEAWAFISGGLFYIIFGAYFLFEMAKNKMTVRKNITVSDKEEWLPVVDEEGKIIGKAPRSHCHNGQKILHPVIHLHVVNKKMIYLQKRAMNKLVQPGKWDTAVGGHISFSETIEQAMAREAKEEIGLENFQPKPVSRYVWESSIEKELIFMFLTYYSGPLKTSPDEVEEGRYWTMKQIDSNLGKGIFTPSFEHEYTILKKIL